MLKHTPGRKLWWQSQNWVYWRNFYPVSKVYYFHSSKLFWKTFYYRSSIKPPEWSSKKSLIAHLILLNYFSREKMWDRMGDRNLNNRIFGVKGKESPVVQTNTIYTGLFSSASFPPMLLCFFRKVLYSCKKAKEAFQLHSCFFILLHWYLLFSCSSPAVQPAPAHTVWHWQDFIWIKKWHPRHQNFHLFSSGKLHTLLHFYCLLPKSTKSLKAFVFSFVSSWLWEQCQSVYSKQLVQREQRGWHFSLAHSFTHLLFPISLPLSIYFSFSD